MVQEVQTWVWVYNETTLETIEAIGTSSFKIVEWRQTKGGHYTSSVETSWTSTWDYIRDVTPRQSPMVVSTDMAISSSSWKAEFTLSNYWIRVPAPWTYQITLHWSWWASTFQPTVYLIRWVNKSDTVLYTKTFSAHDEETITLNVDLGKFEIITIRWSFYYSGSAWVSNPTLVYTLTLQQL